MNRFTSRTNTYGRAVHIGGLIVMREGFSLRTRRHTVEYWTPWAFKPMTIREGLRGRQGRWGAIEIKHKPQPQETP